jgi:hypothetical protein
MTFSLVLLAIAQYARKGIIAVGFSESRGAVMRVALLIPGLIGLAFVVTAGAALTPNTPTTAKFDGTYAFVSWTSLNKTPKHGRGQCFSPATIISPLTIANGQVRYSAGDGRAPAADFEGFVNVQGQFTTRGTNPVSGTAISGYGQIMAMIQYIYDGLVGFVILISFGKDDPSKKRTTRC